MEKFSWLKCYGTIGWNATKYKESYIKHIKEIKGYFKNRPDELLIMNIVGEEGYKKLCPFLKNPILNKTFPHKNIGKFQNN